MGSGSSRANVGVIRSVPTGAGTARQVTAHPGRDTTAPPKGGGNTPNTLGDGGNPAPEVRGLLERNPPLPQEFASAASNASNTSAVPEGLVVKKYRRFVAYRVPNFETFVRLIAELLFKISRSSRGSIVYVNGRKIATLLGLGGTIHPIDLSVVYEVLSRLGFEVVRQTRGKAAIINMGYPLIKKIKAAESINEVVEIVKRHLGE